MNHTGEKALELETRGLTSSCTYGRAMSPCAVTNLTKQGTQTAVTEGALQPLR